MIITIWWEDARQAVRSKAYGPDQLLAACVADDLGCTPQETASRLVGQPKKGAGNLMRCLREDARDFALGPLCVVFDRDKILKLWPKEARPADCKEGICQTIRTEAPGEYQLVLLFDNMETLVEASCRALGRPVPREKRPTERDSALQALAFKGTPDQRRGVREAVDGFGRLVRWTVEQLGTTR